jgi:hypothetical protein
MRKSLNRVVMIGSVVVLLLAAAVSGQGRQPAPPADELLAEVRAMRADVNNAARSAMRAQLLGMRLQLQEQRIGMVSRQLAEVQDKLRAGEQATTAVAASLKMFPGLTPAGHDDSGEGIGQLFAPLKEHLAGLDRDNQRLKGEEAELQQLLAVEQSRWSAFNAQIEELERAAAGAVR